MITFVSQKQKGYTIYMLNFRTFTASDRLLVQSYTINRPFRNCDLAFANMFVWQFLYNTKIAEYNGFLFVKYWFHDKPFYMMPIGEGDLQAAVRTVIEHSKTDSQRFCMQGISPLMRTELERLLPDTFSFTTNRDYSDYLYLREDLINLTGKKYQPKRNHINQFKRSYPNYEFVPITEEIIPKCMELESLWKNLNEDEKDKSYIALDAERQAIQRAFDHYTELNLKGGALVVDNRVVAFTYGSPINTDTFDVAVEKADANYIGAYTMVNNEFVKSLPSQYEFINREEDLGIEGLRKAKLSYHPTEILDKYTAKLI